MFTSAFVDDAIPKDWVRWDNQFLHVPSGRKFRVTVWKFEIKPDFSAHIKYDVEEWDDTAKEWKIYHGHKPGKE